jgi:hypothetical protein
MKPVAPHTCATNVHRDELLSFIRSVQSTASYPEIKSRFHTIDFLRCSYRTNFLDDGTVFTILEKQLEIPKNMTI